MLDFWYGLFSIFVINIVLSGDNAVVIALASRNLPKQQQGRAIFWGSFGAIVLRIVLTLAAVSLLKTVPLLHAIGGILLVIIAWKLLNDEDDHDNVTSSASLGKAIQTVIIADLVMSLDNVLAIAAIAKDSYLLVIIGLAISIPLIIWGSSILMKLMNRFPVIIWIGAGLLCWTAGDMIVHDHILNEYAFYVLGQFHWILPVICIILVLGFSYFLQRRRQHA